MNIRENAQYDSEDFDCDIQEDLLSEPSRACFNPYTSFTNSSKLISDKGKISS